MTQQERLNELAVRNLSVMGEEPSTCRILAIDPGSKKSAWCVVCTINGPAEWGYGLNGTVLRRLFSLGLGDYDAVVIEDITAGPKVGRDTVETAKWAGQFKAAAHPIHSAFVTRNKIRGYFEEHLDQGSADTIIRKKLIERYGKEETKDITSHIWSALAVGTYWLNG